MESDCCVDGKCVCVCVESLTVRDAVVASWTSDCIYGGSFQPPSIAQRNQ